MNFSNLQYFSGEDVIHIKIQDGAEAGSVELSPNITAELNAAGEIIGVEILNATKYIRDNVLDSVQAKLLQRA